MRIIIFLILTLIGSYTLSAQSLTVWNESHDYDITEIKISYPYSQNTYNFIVSNNYTIEWNTSIKLQQPVYGRTAIIYQSLGGEGYYFITIKWNNGFKIQKAFYLFKDRVFHAGATNDGEEWKR